MAIQLGTFTKLDDGVFAGTINTLNVSAGIAIVPVAKTNDKAPDYRVYASGSGRYRTEIGAGWSQVAKASGETYINLKIAAPEFGQNWLRCRLVKVEDEEDASARSTDPSATARTFTHIALWEPRD
jgi:uncharacterized protein (DUF736 family)